jgi:dihydroorotase/N-acyl-D-amino-acid deacylase
LLLAALPVAGATAATARVRRLAREVQALAAKHPTTTSYMRLRAETTGEPIAARARWATLASLPPYLPCAVVKAEDREFFRHGGFDGAQLWRAVTGAITGTRRMGGSTISQQLARNLFLGDERTLRRKLSEAAYTLELERTLDKRAILETYLNVIEWGPRVWGIEAAAQYYFDVPAESLSVSQATYLASIIPNPRAVRPDDPRVERVERRVLHQLAASELVSPAEIQAAAASLGLAPALVEGADEIDAGSAAREGAMGAECGLARELESEENGPKRAARADLVLRGGVIVDGTGRSGYAGDVAISGDRIVGVGRLPAGLRGAREIAAHGLVLAPGFIDMLGQSERTIFHHPLARSKIAQGITSELTGEVDSPWPAASDSGAGARYKSLTDYAGHLRRLRPSINIGLYVSLGTVRRAVMGDRRTTPSADEMRAMAELVDRAMCDGAFGVSAALLYPPASYFHADELAVLARRAALHGGSYATHLRSESEGIFAALDEAIAIGRASGAAVQLHHLKAAGQQQRGRMPQIVDRVRRARAEGVRISADVYPYIASGARLSVLLPSWMSGDGPALAEQVRNPRARARAARDPFLRSIDPARVIISEVRSPALRDVEGLALDRIAARWGETPIDALLSLIARDSGQTGVRLFSMQEDDLEAALRESWVAFGTDGGAQSPARHSTVHPRAFGTMPRILARYVRERHVLGLEEAIQRATSLPALTAGLHGRGILRVGAFADVIAFDPRELRDEATYESPARLASGMRYVFVNGVLTLDDGRTTGARSGRPLTLGRCVEPTVAPSYEAPAVRVTYPRVPVPAGHAITVLGTATDASARITLDGIPVNVAANGAFAAVAPAAARGVTYHRLTAIFRGRTVERHIPIAQSTPKAPSERARSGRAVSRLARVTRSVVVDAYEPGGTYARVYLFPRARIRLDSSRADSVHTVVERGVSIWLPASAVTPVTTKASTAAHRIAPSALTPRPTGPIARDINVRLALGARPTVIVVRERASGYLMHALGVRQPVEAHLETESDAEVRVTMRPADGDVEVLVDVARGLLGYELSQEGSAVVLRVRRVPKFRRAVRALIDPGHPPRGATGPTGVTEATVTLAIARRLQDELRSAGMTAVLSRVDGAPIALRTRVRMAREIGADIVISLHADAAPDGEDPYRHAGPRTMFLHAAAAPLGIAVQRALVEHLALPDRGVIRRSLAMTDIGSAAAILCEVATLTVPEQEQLLARRDFQLATARAIASGVLAFTDQLGVSRDAAPP